MSYGVKYRLEFSDVLAYEKKVEILKECGITISINPSVMGETVAKIINN